MSFKVLVLIIISVLYLYDMLLNIIYMRSAGNRIPANVADVYDKDTYQKWRAYHAEKARFSMFSSTAGFVIDLLLYLLNAYAAFAGCFPKTDFMQMFSVVLLSALAALLLLPFSWYSTMVIEEKYGFNKTTAGTFWADQAKSFVIASHDRNRGTFDVGAQGSGRLADPGFCRTDDDPDSDCGFSLPGAE